MCSSLVHAHSRLLLVMASVVLWACGPAQAQSVETERVWLEPGASLNGTQGPAPAREAVQATLWLGPSASSAPHAAAALTEPQPRALRLGVGLWHEAGGQAQTVLLAGESRSANTQGVLALSGLASGRTRLVLESRWAVDGAGAGSGRPVALGLAVQSSRGSAVSGLRSLTRVQLSADSSLQWRPRRGGLHISYRSNF